MGLTATSAAFVASARRTGAALGVVGAAGAARAPHAPVAPSPLAATAPQHEHVAQGAAAGRRAAPLISVRNAAAGAAALKEKVAELRVGGGSIVL